MFRRICYGENTHVLYHRVRARDLLDTFTRYTLWQCRILEVGHVNFTIGAFRTVNLQSSE